MMKTLLSILVLFGSSQGLSETTYKTVGETGLTIEFTLDENTNEATVLVKDGTGEIVGENYTPFVAIDPWGLYQSGFTLQELQRRGLVTEDDTPEFVQRILTDPYKINTSIDPNNPDSLHWRRQQALAYAQQNGLVDLENPAIKTNIDRMNFANEVYEQNLEIDLAQAQRGIELKVWESTFSAIQGPNAPSILDYFNQTGLLTDNSLSSLGGTYHTLGGSLTDDLNLRIKIFSMLRNRNPTQTNFCTAGGVIEELESEIPNFPDVKKLLDDPEFGEKDDIARGVFASLNSFKAADRVFNFKSMGCLEADYYDELTKKMNEISKYIFERFDPDRLFDKNASKETRSDLTEKFLTPDAMQKKLKEYSKLPTVVNRGFITVNGVPNLVEFYTSQDPQCRPGESILDKGTAAMDKRHIKILHKNLREENAREDEYSGNERYTWHGNKDCFYFVNYCPLENEEQIASANLQVRADDEGKPVPVVEFREGETASSWKLSNKRDYLKRNKENWNNTIKPFMTHREQSLQKNQAVPPDFESQETEKYSMCPKALRRKKEGFVQRSAGNSLPKEVQVSTSHSQGDR